MAREDVVGLVARGGGQIVAAVLVSGGGAARGVVAVEEVVVNLAGERKARCDLAEVELEVGPESDDGIVPWVFSSQERPAGGGLGDARDAQLRSFVVSPIDEARTIPKAEALNTSVDCVG